ncbi:MAG: HEAT repeat domain-containing protein [Cellvibrionaceae bacterium]
MKNFSIELTNAVESDCAHSMEQLMKSKRSQDFSDLLALLKRDADGSYSKVKALYALGRWGDESAIKPIVDIIPTLNELERVTAVDALGRLGSTNALDGVLDLKGDPSPHVRKFVIRALSRFKKPQAEKELKRIQKEDEEAFIRDYAGKYVSQKKPKKKPTK